MDNKQIKDLMAAMGRWKIKKLCVKDREGEELHLERDGDTSAQERPPSPPPKKEHIHHPPPSLSHPHHKVEPPHTEKVEESISVGTSITSPMVGTFYGSPSPDEPPFVKVGDRVDAETIVCIIEAMKVMNEVKAGISGVVREVHLENAQPVEFGTKLFTVE